MSKMTTSVKNQREIEVKKPVTNFMGGTSYKYNPIDTLKMITASSIFGEPSYYRDGEFASARIKDGIYKINKFFEPFDVLPKEFKNETTTQIMEQAIDNALEYDFKATLDWAVVLRNEYNMRLNPQVILVRAAIHPKRQEFNQTNKNYFSTIQKEVMKRADEPASQLAYYLYKNKSKSKIPSILKRTWAHKLENTSRYDLHKYKNAGIGMIDTIRICHANSDSINELMTTGNINISSEENTWESLKSQGLKWSDILSTITLGHMALLRNLRNIFSEIEDVEITENILKQLKDGVLTGKQFPFRYYTAYRMITKDKDVNNKALILKALEDCINISCDNVPKLKGKTVCLSDNSGSAWGTFNSEYGSVTVAEIDNLSSVIAARNSDEGYVGKFGNKVRMFKIDPDKDIIEQTYEITKDRDDDVGGYTEGGIWKFFKNAIENKEFYDNIFIFSDQQAGHASLYGTCEDTKEYRHQRLGAENTMNLDVAKVIERYRTRVNPHVNVFSVQTAGYDNAVIPEYGYRTNLLYGWTGKEVSFANTMIKLWDGFESKDA